jgi:MarR family 2-MHQ and catechol resistance regulon transcriptional repressor
MKKDELALNPMESFYWQLQEKVSKAYRINDLEAIRVTFGIFFTFGAIESQVTKKLQEAKMTLPGLNSLVLLAHGNPDGYPLSELSKYLVSSRANITGVIDSLVSRGLVVRIDHPQDRRSVIARITPQGKKWLDGYFPGHAKLMGSFAGSLTSLERRTLLALLAKIRKGIMQRAMKGERS